MSEWLIRNQKPVLYVILFLFLGLASFYLFQLRPLQAQELRQQEELQRINQTLITYEKQITQSEKQTLTVAETEALLARVPLRPDVEQMVADLERTEIETEIVIDSISIQVVPNEVETENQKWTHVLPEDLYVKVEEEVSDLDHLQVSYVEMTLTLQGTEENIHTFVDQLEQLERIIHVQHYSYETQTDSEDVLGSLSIRAFYTEEFSPFMEETKGFELNYEFDSTKIRAYLEQATKTETATATEEETETNSDQTNEIDGTRTHSSDQTTSTGSTTSSTPTVDDSQDMVSTPVKRVTEQFNLSRASSQLYPSDVGVSELELYYQPATFDHHVKNEDTVLYVVQTGAYNTEFYFMRQLRSLLTNGVYPRTVVREFDPTLTSLVIHTGLAHDRESAQLIGSYLASMGKPFYSYVDRIPLRLPEHEQTLLLPVAHKAVTILSEMATKGISGTDHEVDDALLSSVITEYEEFALEAIKHATEERKIQLKNTITFLSLAEDTIYEYKRTDNQQLLWQTQATLLDFVHSLNGYERYVMK